MIAKLAAIGAGSIAIAVALAIWFESRTPPPPRMMLIGGKATPCTCTHRIEP